MTKKSEPSQGFPKFTRKSSSPDELKLFRSALSQLKKQGLIAKSIDARSARPYFVRGGKTLAELVNKNSSKLTPPVSKSKSPTSKLPPSKPVKKPHLLPKRSPIAFRDLPTKGRSLATVLKDMEANSAKFDAMKRDNEYWAFRIAGTDSRHIFRTAELMVQDAFKYGAGKGPYGNKDVFHSRYRSENLFDKIELIRWTGGISEWGNQRHVKKTKKKSDKRRRKK